MKPEILCLSGGGLKTFLTLGALNRLYMSDYLSEVDTFIGSSAGAVIALLLCIGYGPIEIYNELMDVDININIIGILTDMCVCKDNPLLERVEKMILKKFDYIPTINNIYERTGNKFMCTIFNLNTGKIDILNQTTDKNLSVLEAIKMTTNIPFVFPPTMYNGSYCIDSGIVSNFPIEDIKTTRKILGIDIETESTNEIKSMVDYIVAIINGIMGYVSEIRKTEMEYETIKLKCEKNSVLQLSKEERKLLFGIGWKQCWGKHIIIEHKEGNYKEKKKINKIEEFLKSEEFENLLEFSENNQKELYNIIKRNAKSLYRLSDLIKFGKREKTLLQIENKKE